MAYKTPGVYVQEIALFPPSVAQVETAIPAFIGYTAFALTPDGKTLANTPTRIKSLLEFESLFGTAYIQVAYNVTIDPANNHILGVLPDKRFHLYNALRQYFDNGGGPCYIVSVGSFADTIGFQPLSDGIATLSAYDEPTLILFPDAVELLDATKKPDLLKFSSLQTQALALCARMQDRFSILDVLQGDKPQNVSYKPIDDFRNSVGLNNLNYGAAYYPWIITSYAVNVDFRQLVFWDNANPTPNKITNYDAFSKSQAEKDLVTALQNAMSDTDKVIAQVFSTQADKDALRLGGIDAIKAKLSVFVNNLIKNVTADTQTTGYMNLVSSVAVAFKKAKAAIPANSPLNVDIDRMAKDKKLTDAIVKLVSIEKNVTVKPNMPGRDPKTIYGVLDGTDWLQGLTFDTAPITPDVYTHNAVGGLNIVKAVTDTLNTILSYFAALLSGAQFYENQAEQALFAGNAFFNGVNVATGLEMSTMPPSGSIAGVYANVDGARGVWKAPANVSLNNVVGPVVKIDNSDQDDMNVTSTGKSINAIRAFAGRGTLVWGARTLAGNDNEWRYIPVRRFFIMVEESVKKATYPFVFENNDANTWTKMRVMVQNFLTLQWRAGALQGAKPEDAFFVHVGLNETMTAQDILEGRMIVEIGMAVVRPAEFIILRFMHKMMES
ncbi:phage tail sheath C-terminal domain-containing protein [Mucilaginibacter celer]|uniref:Phage tail protein n=1 Tax=Mucilaginibacter celer TaxID=2305508 RepID=A0A494VLP9_9SPHI|nr:phage tail sheath C-terminal domain-containing protein [Mucilaginibacter celer]AYL94521.1 phage tail protein [Mucilaginibacter celer]